MNRRTFIATSAGLVLAASAGCGESGIFEDRAGSEHVTTVELPDISARDVSPDGASTTFEIRWRAIAASKFDVNPSDGMTATPYLGEGKFVIVAHETTNVGEESHRFDPESFNLETPDTRYQPTAVTHLTPYAPRPLDVGTTTTGWVPFAVPADLPAAEITIDQVRYETPVAIDFEQDSSVPLPF